MAKVPTYCPSCGDTTLQYWEFISPGHHNFMCDTCFTVWKVKIEMIDETPNSKGETVVTIIEETSESNAKANDLNSYQ